VLRRALIALAVLALCAAPAGARKKSKPKGKPGSAAPARAPASDPEAVATLGRANLAYRAGDFATTFTLASSLEAATLRNRDYAVYLAAQAAFLLGDRDRALPRFRKLAGAGASRFRAIAAWRVADCLWDLGKTDAARKDYERLSGAADAAGDRGVAIYRIGEAWAAGGQKAKAAAAWRRLTLELPAHPLAARAFARLGELGKGVLTARERIARAERLTAGRSWNQALAELALVGDGEPPEIRILRDFWIGETLFHMRRQYARAGELLIQVHDQMGGRAAQALFHGARALSRADRDDEAIRWYGEVVRKYPRTEFAAEAQYLSGWLEYNRGDFRAALPGLEGLLARYPRSKWADDAVWYLGYAHYLLGEHDAALRHLSRLAGHGGELEGGKGRYWQARTLAALGRKDEAIAGLRDLVGRYPFSWYSLLARARLAEAGVTVGPFGDRTPSGAAAARLAAVDEALAADPRIARADELAAAGMAVEAGAELRRGEEAFLREYGAARALPILLDRYRKASNYNRPWRLASAYGGRALDLPADGDARPWWEHAYPQAYRELVEKHQGLGANPPYYLYAIMRKESGFHPHDVSYADAIGLLQMIPPTTRRVAPQVGLEYTDDLLYDPELNIEVGAWYIGHLAEKFKQQIPLAAGSFNSGPRPVMRWLDRYGDRPIDELVELVAFTQTREYMKKVTDAYARYLYLWAGQDYRQPLTVDREYVKNDLDY